MTARSREEALRLLSELGEVEQRLARMHAEAAQERLGGEVEDAAVGGDRPLVT